MNGGDSGTVSERRHERSDDERSAQRTHPHALSRTVGGAGSMRDCRGRPYPHGLRGSRCRWLFPLPSDKIFSGENGLLLDAVLTRNAARAITRRRNCPQHRGQRGSKNSGPSCQAFQSSGRTVQVAESRASSRTRDHPSCRPQDCVEIRTSFMPLT